MSKSDNSNSLFACFAAWGAAIVIAFIAGSIYASVLEKGSATEFVAAASRGGKDALQVFLYVGGVSCAVAAVVSAFLIAVLSWPLYLLAKRSSLHSLRPYIFTGVAIVLILIGVLIALHRFNQILVGTDFYFAVLTTVVTSAASMTAFRISVKSNPL